MLNQQLLDQLKQETAAELGIEINPNITSRNAGRIGGNVTKKLIKLGEIKLLEIQQSENLTIYNKDQTIENQIHLH